MPLSRKKPRKQKGFSLAEVLVTMVLVGLSASLLAPRIIESSESQLDNLMVKRIALGQQQMGLAFENYKVRNDIDNDDLLTALENETVKYEDIFFFNGNFFSFKAEGAGGNLKYFYFNDKSRMSFNPLFFRQGTYTNASLPNSIITACDTGIANANQYRCAFIDTNGKKEPNAFSRTGDIIPLMINTDNFRVTTLYQQTGNAAFCSKYDALVSGC